MYFVDNKKSLKRKSRGVVKFVTYLKIINFLKINNKKGDL